jgi:orotidine-5'-phosphate decarboxylase
MKTLFHAGHIDACREVCLLSNDQWLSPAHRWEERIMVALDVPNWPRAEQLLERLKGCGCYMKVGMQLYYAEGPRVVHRLKEAGYKVFLDLKLHDIPNTVKEAAASLARLGADMFNVHAAGGVRMMEAALEGLERECRAGQARPQVVAVTQLTSTDQTVLNEEIGIPGTVEQAVLQYARLAQRAGLNGVVASPREVSAIKQALGEGFVTVTPGIRPRGVEPGDQSRIMTPKEAVEQGSDYLVIGRPITAAPDPRQALEQIVEEMKSIAE